MVVIQHPASICFAVRVRIYDGDVYHTPSSPIFHARYLHSSRNSIGAKTLRRLKHLAERELSEDVLVSFGIGTLLVAEQSSLESRSKGV